MTLKKENETRSSEVIRKFREEMVRLSDGSLKWQILSVVFGSILSLAQPYAEIMVLRTKFFRNYEDMKEMIEATLKDCSEPTIPVDVEDVELFSRLLLSHYIFNRYECVRWAVALGTAAAKEFLDTHTIPCSRIEAEQKYVGELVCNSDSFSLNEKLDATMALAISAEILRSIHDIPKIFEKESGVAWEDFKKYTMPHYIMCHLLSKYDLSCELVGENVRVAMTEKQTEDYNC